MREVEVKILEIDTEKVKKKLKEIGARKEFESRVEYCTYDFEDGRFRRNGGYLRVRKINGKVEVCFKEKVESAKCKVRDETQFVTNDFESITKLLCKVGMHKVHNGYKYRESYRLDDIKYEIDYVPGVPPYIEVEGEDEVQVAKGVEILGFNMGEVSKLSGRKIERIYHGKEIVPVVDDKDKVVGWAERDKVREKRLAHRGVMVIVFNSSGQVYVHKRSQHKKIHSSRWDCFAGGAVALHESYDEAAKRECYEELNISGELKDLFSDWCEQTQCFVKVYSVVYDGKIKFNDGEAVEGKFVEIGEIEKLDIPPDSKIFLKKFMKVQE